MKKAVLTADEAVAFEDLGIPRQRGVAGDGAPVPVDPPGFAIRDVNFRVGGQVRGSGTDGAGEKRVVGVEPNENFTAGLEKTLVRGIGGPLVVASDGADAVSVTG